MVTAFHAGDVDGILATYEADAVVVGEPEAPVNGMANLRAMFEGFIAAKAHFSFRGHEVIQAGDVALHLTPWHMTGQAPDGSKLESTGLSAAVLRRQPSGKMAVRHRPSIWRFHPAAVNQVMLDNSTLDDLVRQAVDGSRVAVESIVRELQGSVSALALRMLWHPQDAEDATQEIIVRVITRLGQFDFKSQFRTWVFRVATNYLLDVKKSCVERQKLTFTDFADDLAQGLSDDGPAEQERSVLTEEVRIGCTLGMLQCLDRPHRLAYVLGEILDLPAPVAAEALELEAGAFRKRLQRAREALESFTRKHCGLVSDEAACACHRRVPAAIRLGRIDPAVPQFAEGRSSFTEARSLIQRIQQALQVVEVHRTTRPRSSPRDFAQLVDAALGPEQPDLS